MLPSKRPCPALAGISAMGQQETSGLPRTARLEPVPACQFLDSLNLAPSGSTGDWLMVRRREFIAGLGSATAMSLSSRPFGAMAQRRIPVVGLLGSNAPLQSPAFAQALKQEGFVAGQNVVFESGFALGSPDRLPGLAANLVTQRVDLILTGGFDTRPLLQKRRQRQSRLSFLWARTRLKRASSRASTARAEM
jgi:hypothetical protein